MYRLPEDGGVPPKHVGVNKKNCIVMYMRCAFVGFVNGQAKHNSYNCDTRVILTCQPFIVLALCCCSSEGSNNNVHSVLT